MKPLTLAQFAETDEGDVSVVLHTKTVLPPKVVENLRRLHRLGLLQDDVVFALIGQAPIDPLGIYGALKKYGVWAFQAIDFTVVQILAKTGDKPVALMRLDLLSDDITFVVLRGGQLVEHRVLTADQIVEQFRTPDITEERVMAWLQGYIDEAVAVGRRAV